ncbi:MAG: hypothetical protein IPL61_16605 [Myxococcales bacterium]|nr:hypothetical protein [Myxococcales bacterium]
MTDDDDRLDLDAWTAPPPPAGLTDRVLDAVHGRGRATALDAPGRPRARRVQALAIGGALAVAASVALALWARAPHRPASGRGQVVAVAPRTVALGDGLEAWVEAGAEVTWTTADGVTRVSHAAGVVTYRHRGALGLAVTTPIGVLTSARATFRVEAPMKRELIVGGAAAAIAVVVVVSVYDGKVSARQDAQPTTEIPAGAQVTLTAPSPTAPPVVAVAKAEVDRARRAEIAQAIARVRQGAAATSGAAAPAMTGTAAAPAPSAPLPAELTKDEIRTAVREVAPMLAECFDAELARDPALGAHTVTARFTIDSAAEVGTVVTVGDLDIPGPLGKSQEFRDCMGATLESAVLPPLGDGGRIEVNYPFVFTPSDDDPAAAPPATTAPAKPAPATKPGPTASASKPGPSTPAPEPTDPGAIAAAAIEAAVNGLYARALFLSERGLAAGATTGTRTRLISVAALSACNLKNTVKARQYYVQATPRARDGIRQTCLRVAHFDPGVVD